MVAKSHDIIKGYACSISIISFFFCKVLFNALSFGDMVLEGDEKL